MSDKPKHLRPVIDPFKVRRRSDPPRPSVELRFDAWDMQQLHRELKAARLASKNALDKAREAVREAETGSIRSYLALASLESHMKPLFEAHGWDFSEFVTLENDSPEGEDA